MMNNSGKQLSPKATVAASVVFMLTGVFIILLGLDVIPADEESFNAPRWVIRLSGMIFFIAGVMIWIGGDSAVNDLLGGVIVLIFGIVGAWVALYGNANDFSGGIPLIAKGNNVFLGRIMFGTGSAFCFMISLYAFRTFIRKWRNPEK